MPETRTYTVHTSNPAWLEHPDTWAHIGRQFGVTVLVQSDIALHDHEYRVYADEGPITKTAPIDEECGRRIRSAIEKHLAAPARVDKPPEPVQLHQHGNQLSLF